MPKIQEKQKAILLRKKGFSYNEILREIPVAKSTLSLWLRAVGLSLPQKQKISQKRKDAQAKGAKARHNQRIFSQDKIYSEAEKEIGMLSKRELWLVGIALYWAEGSKEKEYSPGIGVCFNNSDARMVRIFILWLKICCGISEDQLDVSIYVHESSSHKVSEIKKYWSQYTDLPIEKFKKVYLKKHSLKLSRKNIGDLYNGLLRVRVCSSSILNRKITGWIKGIYNCGIV